MRRYHWTPEKVCAKNYSRQEKGKYEIRIVGSIVFRTRSRTTGRRVLKRPDLINIVIGRSSIDASA